MSLEMSHTLRPQTTQTQKQVGRIAQIMKFLELQSQQLETLISEELQTNPVFVDTLDLNNEMQEDDFPSEQDIDSSSSDNANEDGESSSEDNDIEDDLLNSSQPDFFENYVDTDDDESDSDPSDRSNFDQTEPYPSDREKIYDPNDQEYPQRSVEAREDDSERRLDYLQNIPAPQQSLQDYLMEQLNLAKCPEDVFPYAAVIIYNLNHKGWLRPERRASWEDDLDQKNDSEKERKETSGLSRDALLQYYLELPFRKAEAGVTKDLSSEELHLIAEGLKIVQSFDPKGVGARDSKECLLLQISDAMPNAELLRTLILDHLDDLGENRLSNITRQMEISELEILTLKAQIQGLNPYPGADFNAEEAPPILPDVYVEKKNGIWEIRTEDGLSTQLSISPKYDTMSKNETTDARTRSYLKKQIKSANWLLEMIEMRKQTLLNVSREIVEYQKAFLEGGPEKIRPMTQQIIAEKLKTDVSTVSRACKDKWLQTPLGIFPFKRLFSGTVQICGQNSDEEGLSKDAVFVILRTFINTEDKKKPLSDDKLVEMFRNDNINISRRTITKYRDILDIPNSNDRRNR